MKEIQLTQGKVALVDDEVYEWASKHKWYALWNGYNWYAVRYEGRNTIYLHREITNAPDGVRVDHQDRDSLNNLDSNLRFATNGQNMQNTGPNAKNTSGYKGVTWDKAAGKWLAQITASGRNINLGRFTDPIEAARAYDKAARKHHKEFAYQNFPEEQL